MKLRIGPRSLYCAMTRSVVTVHPSTTANQATLRSHKHTDSCVGTRASGLRCSRSGWHKNERRKVFTNTGCTPQAPELARLPRGISRMTDPPVILVHAVSCPFIPNCNGRSVTPVMQIEVSESRPRLTHNSASSCLEGTWEVLIETLTHCSVCLPTQNAAAITPSGRI